MSELKFPAEVKERAISGSVALGDHGSCDNKCQDGVRHVIDSSQSGACKLKNQTDRGSRSCVSDNDNEYADDDEDDDDGSELIVTEGHDLEVCNDEDSKASENGLATAVARGRLSRLKSERLRLMEEMRCQRKRYEKYLDKLTCQLFKVLLSQKKLKSDCSNLVERVSALESDNQRLKETLDKWSAQSKHPTSTPHHPSTIEPINYFIERPSSGTAPFIDFSSISDQPQSTHTLENHPGLCFFFHTHPPTLTRALTSLQRIQLLPPPACPCDKQMAVDLGGLGRYREDQNEYYNLDSSGQAIASSRSCGRCSGVNRGREVDVAWNDSTCSDHYDQVYQERPLVPCGKESATGGKHFSRDSFRDRTFPCPGNGENGVMSRSQFLKFDADDNEEDGNGGMETPYETTDDYHHHHHHHRHERCHVNFDRTQEHQLLNEHREHPYQNLTKSGSNLSRSSGTAASLHSVFSSADADQHYMTSCSASLAPLSSSFYYTPGCYSQSADRNFIEECKTETISLRNKGKTKSPGVSLYSEISSHVDCRYEDSLEECQKVKVMTSDCRLPTTATYRIKNATVARLVPIDRVISEELDEMNRLDEPGSLPGDPSAAAEWNGTEVDGHAHSRHCGLENANDASDAAFSCPWKLRLDEEGEDSIISSINENEDFNMFEDEHEDYARLTKPLGRTAGSQDGVYSRNHRGSSDDACHDSETTTMSNSSKFLNAFGFLISREGEEASSHFLLRDFISELDISPPNSVSLSCLSLSPNSVDKTESLFETSSACLTDALGRSMDESSLSSFFVFETSGQGFPSNSTTMKKDDGSPDYTALVNRNERTKTYANDPGHRKEGFGTIGGSEIKNNMLNDIKQQQRPRQENSDDHVGNYRENEEMKSKDFIENPACGQIHNSTSTLSLTKSQLSTAQTPNGTTGKLSLATQSGSPSSILRKVSLFSNSKIPGSPKNLIRSNITTTALSNIPNSLHSSISVPFRHTPPPNRHTSRNSLPPLNQMKPPSSKCSAPSKTGGFFRFNSKLLGSAPASKSAAANQPAKTSPKATPKSERSIFKFSSPKNRRSSVTVTPGTGEEINTGTPPAGKKKNGVCKTV